MNKDPYKELAAKMFDKAVEKVTQKERAYAKQRAYLSCYTSPLLRQQKSFSEVSFPSYDECERKILAYWKGAVK